MLSSVLNSDRAIKINIQIMRIYTRIREMILTHKDILSKLEKVEQRMANQDNQILVIFEYLKQFEQEKQIQLELQNRRKIGYSKEE